MRRALIQLALLCVVLVTAVGAGCDGQSDTENRRINLILAVSVNARDRPSYQQAVREFTAAHPEIHVEIMEVAGNFYQKMLVMMAARNAPDLMWMGQGFYSLVDRGVFLDITDRVARDIKKEDVAPEALEWYRFNNRQYGIAFGLDLRLICYNKALFDKAGVPYPRDGWTFDEFLKTARALTFDFDGDGKIDQYGFEGDLDKSLFKAKIVAEDGKRAACDSPEMIEFLQTNLDLAEKHHVSPHGRQMVNEAMIDPVAEFRQGRKAMMTMATWNLPEIQDRCADMQWDVVSNPLVRQNAHWGSSQAIVISSETRHPEEAWLLARKFLEKDFQVRKYPVIVPATIAAQQELETSLRGKAPNVASMVIASHSLYRTPRIPHVLEYQQFWLDATESVWNLRLTPEVAMRRATADINRAMAMHREDEP